MPNDSRKPAKEDLRHLNDLEDEQIDRLTARVFCAGGPCPNLSPELLRQLGYR